MPQPQRRPAGGGSAGGRPPRRYRRPAPDAARVAAYDVLRAVDERDAYANLVLPGLLRERNLAGRDAGFATELAYGTLRGLGTYDAVLAACIDRPLAQVDPPVLDVLRLGAHQLLAMRVPPHAAVSATVELARGVLGDGRAKFVNAVLRRVEARDLPGWLEQVSPAEPLAALAVARSHPRWVVGALRDALGGARARGGAGAAQADDPGLDAELDALLAADNEPAAVSLVARPGRADVEGLLAAGAEPGRWSPVAARWSGDPREAPGVTEGRVGVQDEGSQLVALALAAVPVEGADRTWVDLCAGPGGKAALLAALAGQRGARLVAVERQEHRARLVRRAVGADLPAVVVTADGTAPPVAPGTADRVLVDVPCTGLGALRRRPEARWRRTPQDVAALAPLQRALLGAALDLVRPGGVVAYVTCSPHLAETGVVVDDVLRRRPDVERIDARPFLPGVPALGAGPDVQLWPHVHGTDAMHLTLLRRS
ncbi:MAG TPA: transcription antitermination factor NusB [Motilibacteraceae bacterium]|nr:transcription antitermination factor NusB [Motilibacteraceae bacterium]